MKNLAIFFCSFRPSNLTSQVNDIRETEYFNCLNQLLRVIPKNFDILICENTIDSKEELSNQDLNNFLKNQNTLFTGSETNIGQENKGLGELLMLKNALKSLKLNSYTFISYITARRFFTCPYVFERTNSLKKEALISNPDFMYLNGKFLRSEKHRMFNDMFFSMTTEKMINYSQFSSSFLKKKSSFNILSKIRANIGSEQILYKYVSLNKITYEYLEWLGVIRNDWQNYNLKSDISNYHIC